MFVDKHHVLINLEIVDADGQLEGAYMPKIHETSDETYNMNGKLDFAAKNKYVRIGADKHDNTAHLKNTRTSGG